MLVFSIYDSKSEEYDQPFFARTPGEAERYISSLVRKPDHHLCMFAEDYSLFEVGHWNAKDGILSGQAPRVVTGCWTLKAMLKNGGNNAGTL